MPGPPPKDPSSRRRRNAPAEVVLLPARGRQGKTPAWPLSKQRAGEARVWRDLWATPQATVWDELGWTRLVARYCRCLVEADKEGAPIVLLGEVRQLEDRLGLSPMAMKRLQWRIGDEEETSERATLAPVVSADRWRKLGA